MAILSIPHTSIDGDRKVTAAQLARAAAVLTTSGIVPIENSFLCSKVDGTMGVSVAAGEARITGHDIVSDSAETVTLAAGHATYPRIDIVALEANDNTGVRTSRIVVVQGTPATSPTAPALTQTDALWQEALCTVLVPAGATTLNNATITDVRSFCIGKHRHAISDITGLQEALNGKAASSHTHTTAQVTGLDAALAGKAATSHTHDDRYYTETEVATLLAGKAAASHTHDDRYYTETEINTKLAAKEDTLDADQKRKITVSTSSPSGGVNGDIWIKVI